MIEKTILLGQTPYAYLDEGQGAVIVLVHGSLCDYRYWKWQIAELAQHYRVIAPSLRHYAPVPLSSTDDFSITQHAQDLHDVLECLSIPNAHVLGHSRGAAVALELALSHPEQVSSLILADAGVRNPQQLEQGLSFKQEALRLIQAGQLDEGLSFFIDGVSGVGTYKKMVRWFKEMVKENAHTLFLQQFESPFLINDRLKTLHLPITLISGADSPAPFPEISQQLHHLWEQAQHHVLSPASHGMNLSLPHEFNRLVLNHVHAIEGH